MEVAEDEDQENGPALAKRGPGHLRGPGLSQQRLGREASCPGGRTTSLMGPRRPDPPGRPATHPRPRGITGSSADEEQAFGGRGPARGGRGRGVPRIPPSAGGPLVAACVAGASAGRGASTAAVRGVAGAAGRG